MVISADVFAVLLQYFWSSMGNLIITVFKCAKVLKKALQRLDLISGLGD